jgi:hypothetical protein
VDLVPAEEAVPMRTSPEAEEPAQESDQQEGDSMTKSEYIEPVRRESVTKEFGAGDIETLELALDNAPLSKLIEAEAVLPSPATSSLAKVAEYLHGRAGQTALPAAASIDDITDKSDMDCSVGSHSVASRHSDLSSLSGVRMRGLFHGTALAAAAPACPFPEDWQYNIIPEVIENDEDID